LAAIPAYWASCSSASKFPSSYRINTNKYFVNKDKEVEKFATEWGILFCHRFGQVSFQPLLLSLGVK